MRPRTTYKVQSTTHNQGGIETPLAQRTHVTRTKYKGQYCTVWWTARACVGGGCAVFCVITVECPFFYFRVRKITTFTAFLDVFWLNYALLRIQSCRSKALINALAYLRILLNLHFAIDKLENS